MGSVRGGREVTWGKASREDMGLHVPTMEGQREERAGLKGGIPRLEGSWSPLRRRKY